MDAPHQLQTLLQFLVTDASSTAHLAYILDHLSLSSLAPSPHLHKWVTRVTSLMHSKDPAARWAAMCIAYRMSSLSKSLLVETAQSWVGCIFPSLLKPEPVPILRTSMRYLTLVLCAAGHNLEFQRQVAIPIVPKVSLALLTIAEKYDDREIKTSSIRSLTQLVPLYPSLHKALSQRLFALCHQIFSGSMHYTAESLLDATVNLYSVLHFLGGKVGGTNLWQSCLAEILQFSWSAWLALRSTFPASAQLSHRAIAYLRSPDGNLPDLFSHANSTTDNPLTIVALNLDKLKCGISTISALLRVPINRPVRVPIGHLTTFCWCLLASTREDEGQSDFDPHVRVVESAVVPQIWVQACRMLSCLAETAQDLLVPHISRLITLISSHLEDNLEPSQRHPFLRCVYHLLYFCPVVGAAPAVNRLMKAVVPLLSPLYLHQPWTELNSGASSRSRTSKKRRRGYEADNALSVNNTTVSTTTGECDTLITALDVVYQCMLHVELAPSTRSIASRVLLSILLSLPSIPPSSLSSDPNFHGKVVKRVRDLCVESVQGTSHAMSRGTGLVLRSFSTENLATRDKLHSHVDLLLHPRRPPFVRTLPFVDSLSLSSAEENSEEVTTRRSLGLVFGNGGIRSITCEHCESRTCLEPVVQGSLVLDQQTSVNSPQERASPTSVDPHPQTAIDTNGKSSMNSPTPTVAAVAPPLQSVSDMPAGPSLLTSQKEPTPNVYVARMLLDESDHEEVPTIDLGSDSEV